MDLYIHIFFQQGQHLNRQTYHDKLLEGSKKNLFYPVLLFYIQHISLDSLYFLTLTLLCVAYHPPLPLLRVGM